MAGGATKTVKRGPGPETRPAFERPVLVAAPELGSIHFGRGKKAVELTTGEEVAEHILAHGLHTVFKDWNGRNEWEKELMWQGLSELRNISRSIVQCLKSAVYDDVTQTPAVGTARLLEFLQDREQSVEKPEELRAVVGMLLDIAEVQLAVANNIPLEEMGDSGVD